MPYGFGYYNPFYGYGSPFNYSNSRFESEINAPVDSK
jgi:hypothetical protein